MAYITLKRLEKLTVLDQNHGLTPLEKLQFLDFLNVVFCSLKMRFFILKYLKTHFSRLYWLKKGGKIAISGP